MYRKLISNCQEMREEDPMLRTSKLRRYIVPALGASIALASLAFGQQKEQFAKAQKENSAALEQYTWKSRTKIKMEGESKSVKLEQVRYDLDGKQQKTPIGEPPQQQAQQEAGRRGGGRLKAKVIENKKEEFAELMQSLGQLVASYAHMPPDKIQGLRPERDRRPGPGTKRNRGAHSRVECHGAWRHDERLDRPSELRHAAPRDPDVVRGQAGALHGRV